MRPEIQLVKRTVDHIGCLNNVPVFACSNMIMKWTLCVCGVVLCVCVCMRMISLCVTCTCVYECVLIHHSDLV